MLNFDEAWGKKFNCLDVEPQSLAVMIVACSQNLTGARAVSDTAYEVHNSRLSALLRPFLETVLFIQRDYHANPEHKVVILGTNGRPMSVIIKDSNGKIVYDPREDQRVSVTGINYLYRVPSVRPHVYNSMPLQELASISYLDGVKELRKRDLWKDNSWGYDQDFARGSNYL